MDQKQRAQLAEQEQIEMQMQARKDSGSSHQKSELAEQLERERLAAKMAEEEYPCSACGEKLSKEHFSKNQLSKVKKNEKGRCKRCIESSD